MDDENTTGGIRFAAIPGYPNYWASDDGRIWSTQHTGGDGGGVFTGDRRELKTQRIKKGYLVLHLRRNKVRRTFAVHQLILLAFHGPCPEGMECAHANGKPDDNRLSNLRWATPSENQRDKVLHGTYGRTITPSDARSIKSALSTGLDISSIASTHGVPDYIVKNIKYGNSWNWIK